MADSKMVGPSGGSWRQWVIASRLAVVQKCEAYALLIRELAPDLSAKIAAAASLREIVLEERPVLCSCEVGTAVATFENDRESAAARAITGLNADQAHQ
jgi:hypothetical protein